VCDEITLPPIDLNSSPSSSSRPGSIPGTFETITDDILRQEDTVTGCVAEVSEEIKNHVSTDCTLNSDCIGSCRLFGEHPDQFLDCDNYDILTDFQSVCDEITLPPIDANTNPLTDSAAPLPVDTIIRDQNSEEITIDSSCLSDSEVSEVIVVGCRSNDDCAGYCRRFETSNGTQFLDCDNMNNFGNIYGRLCDTIEHGGSRRRMYSTN